MSHGLHIQVYLPDTARFDIDAKGVTHHVDDGVSWTMPLAEAEKRLDAALRSVRVLLEVEPGRASVLLAETCGDDPSRPSPAPSQPYCPFCQTPTCKCWMGHVCR